MNTKINHPAFVTASGKEVTRLGQGTWHMAERPAKRKDEIASLKTGIEFGLNLIDTAEMYGEGMSESLISEALKGEKREDIFIVSKVYPHNAGRRNIFAACENSLRRLGTDYLDTYLLHWRGSIPFEETVECMEELKARGRIRNWGVSNLDTDEMDELFEVPDGTNCVTNQVLYHLASRGVEYDLMPWIEEKKMTMMAYCPLAQYGDLKRGLLTNKNLLEVAAKYQVSPAQVLLAFTLRKEFVIPIPKSSSPAHTADNAKALLLELTAEDIALLSKDYPAPGRKMSLDIV